MRLKDLFHHKNGSKNHHKDDYFVTVEFEWGSGAWLLIFAGVGVWMMVFFI